VPRPFRPTRPLTLLALGGVALALAACGGSSPSSAGEGSKDEETRLAFQDCLRDKGVDVQISPDGRGMAIRSEAPSARAGSSGGPGDRTKDALGECRKQTGWAPPEPSEAEKVEMRDRALRFARCMREHGVDIPDPSTDGRMTLRVNPGSPTFRSAQRACGAGMAMPLSATEAR
jgi:hypothetical protein